MLSHSPKSVQAFDLMQVMRDFVEVDRQTWEIAKVKHRGNCAHLESVETILANSQMAHDTVAELIEAVSALMESGCYVAPTALATRLRTALQRVRGASA